MESSSVTVTTLEVSAAPPTPLHSKTSPPEIRTEICLDLRSQVEKAPAPFTFDDDVEMEPRKEASV